MIHYQNIVKGSSKQNQYIFNASSKHNQEINNASSSHNQEVFFKESINDIGFISSKFQDRNGDINNGNTRLMHYVYWRQGIYWTGDDSYTNGARCARRCLLAHDNHCHYYIVKNGRCQLGRFTHGGGNYYGSFSNYDVIRLKKHIGKH